MALLYPHFLVDVQCSAPESAGDVHIEGLSEVKCGGVAPAPFVLVYMQATPTTSLPLLVDLK